VRNHFWWLALAGLLGCATPAVVFVSPQYRPGRVQRVAVQGFGDAAGHPGSGAAMADIFEKYLFNLHYTIVDPSQADRDAVVTGSLSEMNEASEQTVMVDIPQEVTEPVYQDVTFQTRHGGVRTVTRQVGTQTTMTSQTVPQTEMLPARVGVSVRLIDAKGGELLWSGSATADGRDGSSAADAAASKIVSALQKKVDEKSAAK